MTTFNGWTAEKLYELKQKVDTTYEKLLEIERRMGKRLDYLESMLRRMESEETESLREQIRELQQRPQRQIAAVVVPFICACIPAVVLLLSHA